MALEAGGMGTWDWDLSADRFNGSTQSTTLFNIGAESADMGGTSVLAHIHASDRHRVLRQFAEVFRDGASDLVLEFRTGWAGRPVRWP